jgi:hypothetical protein
MPRNEHTQGPLTIHGPSDGKGPYDDGGDYAIVDADGKIIGEAIHKVDYAEFRPARANAHLWAAAPDLLVACEEALEWVGHPDIDYQDDDTWARHWSVKEELQSAIAKANGESNA